jgi:hypothetical protein
LSSRSPLTSELAERLGTYLRAHRGFSLCVHCLAHELGTRPALVRAAMDTLEAQGDFPARITQCVSCLIVKPVIRYERLAEVPDPAQRVAALLREDVALGFCMTCVAFACEIALADANRVLAEIERLPEFEQISGACAACGRWHVVVRVAGGPKT